MSVLGQATARRAAVPVLVLALAAAVALAAAAIAPAEVAAAMDRPVNKIEIISVAGQRSAPDQPLLVVHVSNKGRQAADLFGELRLTHGPSGSTAGPFREPPVVSIEPGQQADVDFALPATLPAGPWLATVTLTSGQYAVTAKSTVTFADPKAPWSWVTVAGMVTVASILIALIIIGMAFLARQTIA